MGKHRARIISWKKTILIFVAFVIFLVPDQFAYANSTAPPSVVWLSFDYKTASPPRLLGVQLIACTTANCEQPVLMKQYGACDRLGCLPSQPKMTGLTNDFGCAANICRSSAYPSHGGSYFKLVAQFSDRVRTSEVVEKLPSNYGEDSAWQVIVRDTDLSIEAESLPAVSNPGRVYPRQPLLVFGLSILVEILVAGVCFWRTVEPRYFEWTLLMVLLVNLLSLPVVWFFFPSLGQFQSKANQSIGILVLFLALIYAVLLAGIYRSGNKARKWLIALTLLSLPVTIFCSLVAFSFLPGYYGRNVIIQGLPANLEITASEVFAVVFEAILITLLSKRSLPLRLIWVTSLLMNAASFGIGLLITGAAASMPTVSGVPPVPPTVPPPTSLPPLILSTATPIAAKTYEPNGWTSHGPDGVIILALAIDPLVPTPLYAGTSFGVVFKSKDSGENWILVKAGVNVRALVIDPVTPSSLYAGTWSDVFKSTDSSRIWEAANTGLHANDVRTLAIDPATLASLSAGTYGRGVFAINQVKLRREPLK